MSGTRREGSGAPARRLAALANLEMPAAGWDHTVLLRSDGTVAAVGKNDYGECDMPEVEQGMTYTQVACGAFETVLLRSDGQAVSCGSNGHGECNIPEAQFGVSYT